MVLAKTPPSDYDSPAPAILQRIRICRTRADYDVGMQEATKTVADINYHDSLAVPIIHTNISRSDPSKYFYVSSQSYFVCTRRLSGPPLIHRLWK